MTSVSSKTRSRTTWKYNPSTGGHAPGEVRSSFTEWVEDGIHPGIDGLGVEELVGTLWNCTDVLPGTCCDALELPAGSTYAQGVRSLRRKGVA